MTLYVTEAQVAELLTPRAAFDAVAGSFARLARGVVENPSRVRAALPGGDFAVMSCVDHELGYAGLKAFVWLPGGTPFLVVLFSIERASLEAVVEAELLGRVRTAAASAVAAARLARAGATTLGIVGTGRQAASHVAALRDAVPGLDRVVVCGRDAGRLADFCREHGCEPAESAKAVAACDVVVTVTTAKEPVVHGEWLAPGSTVIGVGANDPAVRELDDAVLERAALVCCDSRAQSQLESGDLIDSVAHGVLDWSEVHELQDVLAGSQAGRRSDDEIVVFKSNGLAAWDIAVTARVVELARAGS